MIDNIELFKSLFIDINPSIIDSDKIEVPKNIIKYIKNIQKYTTSVKVYKTYRNITKIYEERKLNKDLLYKEYYISIYLIYILNSNIINEEEKKIFIENIISFYDNKLSNNSIISLEENSLLRIYNYVDISVKHIYSTIDKINILENNNYKTKGLTDVLNKNINSIMKSFIILLKEDLKNINEQHNKKRIK